MTAAAPGRRVTPTARLIMSAEDMHQDRGAWLAARRRGVGSSDVPAIMGVVEQRTPLHVYYDKLGALDDHAGEAALWGTLHEDTVAREWARRNRSVVQRVGLVARVDEPWMQCSLDRRVTECPLSRGDRQVCAVEVKTRSAWLSSHWRRDVPDDVLAQTLWQLAVTGLDHIHVAVLLGGNTYRQRVVRRVGNGDLIGDIVSVCRQFWQGHVLPERPPAADGSGDALVDLYDRMNPDRGGYVEPDPEQLLGAIREYETARLIESTGRTRKKKAKASLVGLLGSADLAVMDDHEAVSYPQRAKRHVDVDRLAERWPDAYADVVEDRPYRQIEIAQPYRLRAEDIEGTPGE